MEGKEPLRWVMNLTTAPVSPGGGCKTGEYYLHQEGKSKRLTREKMRVGAIRKGWEWGFGGPVGREWVRNCTVERRVLSGGR